MKFEQFAIIMVFTALIISICYISNDIISKDYSIPKSNYYGLALMNLIPNSYPCIYEQKDLYESTDIVREYLGTKYLILVNKFTGDTCPIRI